MASTTAEFGWQGRAACRGGDAGLFFPPGHEESREEKAVRERRAKTICATCPVRLECLEYAVDRKEPYGVWGGLNEAERRYLIRERTRGLRPVS